MYTILTNIAFGDDDSDGEDRKSRLSELCMAVFSCGPAWSGNQSSIILDSEFSIDMILDKISPFLKDGDLSVIIDHNSGNSITIGFLADEEGFDQVIPGAKKVGISPSGMTYSIG